jgi:hypothetical protein
MLLCFVLSEHLIEYGCMGRVIPKLSCSKKISIEAIRLLAASAGAAFVFIDIHLIVITNDKCWRFSQVVFVIGTFLIAIRAIKYGISGRWGYDRLK